MNSFLELCQNRRSYRKYTDEPVSEEDLEYITRCALMSPAGKRVNPWEFVVVTRPEVLRRMSGCRTYGSQMFDTAMAGIVVALDSSLIDTWQSDGAIAAENILLAAADRGLGACWCQVMGRENEEAGRAEDLIRRLTNLPDHLTVLCVISLGHKNEERKPYDLTKLQYHKVHREQY